MKRALIYYKDVLAGRLTEGDDGFEFQYDKAYLDNAHAQPVSLTLPLREEAYQSPLLFPFFDGLIPEGWLLNLVSHNWKIDQRDRFGLLLVACRDCVGAVSIREARL